MDFINALIDQGATLFTYPLRGSERIFICYLLAAAILGYWSFTRFASSELKTRKYGFLAYLFPKEVYLHPSAKRDYIYFAVNAVFYGLMFIPLLTLGDLGQRGIQAGLFLVFGEGNYWQSNGVWVFAATLAVLLAVDFALYLTHYLQHKVWFLWEFHKLHHAAEVMTPITVYRQHPVDLLVTMGLSGLLGGMAFGLFAYLLRGELFLYAVFGLNIFTFLFYLAGYNLRHSHIWLPFPVKLSRWIVSPAMHQIHHSNHPRHFDKNMGFMFAFWDRLFGTLYVPEKKEDITFGIDERESRRFNSVWAFYVAPFVMLWERLREAAPRRRLGAGGIAAVMIMLVSLPLWAETTSQKEAFAAPASDSPLPSVHLEALTWTEVRDALDAGYKTVIIPTGGTEQNGPHVTLGKHNAIIRYTAGEIAKELGGALVAPVVSYVPEGRISPPEGHMKFAGTISISEWLFGQILASTAESLRQHGFTTIIFLGDSGGNQTAQDRIAGRLDHRWRKEGVHVWHIGEYYSKNGQVRFLQADGHSREKIGTHAGIRDTSELLAVKPEWVRENRAGIRGLEPFEKTGVNGNPSLASAEIGQHMLQLKIRAGLKEIRERMAETESLALEEAQAVKARPE